MSNEKEPQISASDCSDDSDIEDSGANKIEVEQEHPITPGTHFQSESEEDIPFAQVP